MKFKVGDKVKFKDDNDLNITMEILDLNYQECGIIISHPYGWTDENHESVLYACEEDLELVDSSFHTKNKTTFPTGGVKHDSGKPQISQIPFSSLEEVAKCLMFGEKKYKRYNWKKGLPITKYLDAAFRHLGAFSDGIDVDNESGENHVAHAATNLLMLLWTLQNKPELDDRDKGDEEGPENDCQ